MSRRPEDRFRDDLAASQGNFALRNIESTRRRTAEALSSKDFKTPPVVRFGFNILGWFLALLGVVGLAAFSLSIAGGYVLLFSVFLLTFGVAILYSNRRMGS